MGKLKIALEKHRMDEKSAEKKAKAEEQRLKETISKTIVTNTNSKTSEDILNHDLRKDNITAVPNRSYYQFFYDLSSRFNDIYGVHKLSNGDIVFQERADYHKDLIFRQDSSSGEPKLINTISKEKFPCSHPSLGPCVAGYVSMPDGRIAMFGLRYNYSTRPSSNPLYLYIRKPGNDDNPIIVEIPDSGYGEVKKLVPLSNGRIAIFKTDRQFNTKVYFYRPGLFGTKGKISENKTLRGITDVLELPNGKIAFFINSEEVILYNPRFGFNPFLAKKIKKSEIEPLIIELLNDKKFPEKTIEYGGDFYYDYKHDLILTTDNIFIDPLTKDKLIIPYIYSVFLVLDSGDLITVDRLQRVRLWRQPL